MKIKLTFTEDVLGTASANPDIHREFIASKAPDAEGIKEEVAALGVEACIEKSMTVFPKFDGKPFFWDYQIKGFFKEAIGALIEILPEQKVGKSKLSKFTHKRIVDNYIFIAPRKVVVDGKLGNVCVRPLRADTMQGERVALASSETVEAGSSITFEVKFLVPSLEALVRAALDYGANKGIGQWRNSGKGRFTWEEVGA